MNVLSKNIAFFLSLSHLVFIFTNIVLNFPAYISNVKVFLGIDVVWIGVIVYNTGKG